MSLKKVLIFPGQGSQFVGMGKEVCAKNKQIFEKANEILGFNLSKMMFEGDLTELTKTSNAQPAILTNSVAVYELYKNIHKFDATLGHSVGEFASLVVANSITFEDALRLVRKRGEVMEGSVNREFEMMVFMGCPLDTVEQICRESEQATNLVCEVAAINSDTQITLSGDKEAIEYACNLAKSHGIRRPIRLKVGGAFHSKLMEPAAQIMKKHLNSITWKQPEIPVISNVTGQPYKNTQEIPELLSKQIHTRVNFYSGMMYCRQNWNPLEFIEMGPKSCLISLYKNEKTLFVGN